MIGNIHVHLIKIVSNMCARPVNIVLIQMGSAQEQMLLDMTEGKGTFPMLEYSPGELLCDSFSISAMLVRASNKE